VTKPKPKATTKPRIYGMSFASVYPLYIQKAENKGRTKELDAKTDFETFFAEAPHFQPKASLITGVVCHVRVEDIEDETMRKIRYLDKLVDELAKGKAMAKILRT